MNLGAVAARFGPRFGFIGAWRNFVRARGLVFEITICSDEYVGHSKYPFALIAQKIHRHMHGSLSLLSGVITRPSSVEKACSGRKWHDRVRFGPK